MADLPSPGTQFSVGVFLAVFGATGIWFGGLVALFTWWGE